jgi:hypothetical protein
MDREIASLMARSSFDKKNDGVLAGSERHDVKAYVLHVGIVAVGTISEAQRKPEDMKRGPI